MLSKTTPVTDFAALRRNIIGDSHILYTQAHPAGIPMLYADWTASGRAYAPIERAIRERILPLIANTHTDTNSSGSAATHAYATIPLDI